MTLAGIKDTASKVAGQPARTVYVNPQNVAAVESIGNGTRITMNDGTAYQTTLDVASVVSTIDAAMA